MEKYALNIETKRIQEFIEGIREGLPLTRAADLAFIPHFYIYRWRSSYNEFMSKVESGEITDLSLLEIPVDKEDNLVYSKLNTLTISAIITHAQADCQKTYLKNLKEDNDHFQKWAWLLERSFRKEFGKDVVEETPNKTIDKIQVVYVEKDQDKDRLAKLEQEVKESLSIEDGNTN